MCGGLRRDLVRPLPAHRARLRPARRGLPRRALRQGGRRRGARTASVAAQLRVSALPTFLVFKDGKEVARIQGADEAGLRAALDKAGCPPPKNDVAFAYP